MVVIVRLLTALLFLVAAAYADGFQVDVKRIESQHSKLVREGKWAAYRNLKSAVHSSRLAVSSQPQPVLDYEDGEYIANITIGTPPQKFLVLLSMKSSSFWVPDKSCPGQKCPYYCGDVATCKALCDPRCCRSRNAARSSPHRLGWLGDCGWRNRFDSSKSWTYRKNGTLLYGSDAEGFIGIDTLMLGDVGGLEIPSQTFGQATTASLAEDDAYDGLLGINSNVFGVPGIVPFLSNAKTQGVIEKNLVTIALIREGIWSADLPGGSITYGAVDTKNCDAVETYVPAFYRDPAVLALEGITLGNVNARPDANAAWVAAFDFDTTALTGPVDVISALAQEVGAVSDLGGLFYIACNATVPSLFLTFNGHQYEIPSSELVRPHSTVDSECIFNVFARDPSVDKNNFSIGASLGRKYCLVFDYDNARLGFAANRYGK